MNKLFLLFCAVALFSGCVKKEEESPAADNTYTNYRVVTVANGGTISGTVVRSDSGSYLERLSIQRDQAVCGDSHSNPSDPGSKGVRGCVVWLEGIREGKAFGYEKSPKLEQRGCEFLPHVQIVEPGATMLVTNEDDALHNYHVTLGTETVTNEAQPEGSPARELIISKKGLHKVACDVHPWMKAFIMAAEHPYFAVSDADGKFRFTDVPPGQYTLKVWRDDWRVEELKNAEGRIVSYKWKDDLTKETEVVVTGGQETVADISLP